MTNFIRRSLAYTFLCMASIVQAQELKTGSIVPNIELNATLNGKQKKIKLHALNAKMVILDFWNTRCGACIRSFPKIRALQKKYKGDIQFLMVTPDNDKMVTEYFLGRKKQIIPDAYYINTDTTCVKFFPHDYFPHYVMIKEGKQVYAIPDYLTEEHIQAFLAGREIIGKQEETPAPMEKKSPLLDESVFATKWPEVASYFYLLPAIDTMNWNASFLKMNGSKLTNRILLNKFSAIDLYLLCLEANRSFIHKGNQIIKLKDSLKFRDQKYLYDRLVPSHMAEDKFRLMKQDLDNIFGLNAGIEKRVMPCYILQRSHSADTLLSIKNGSDTANDTLWRFTDIPFVKFARSIQRAFNNENLNFVDETGYTQNIDIAISQFVIKPLDIDLLQSELRKYNLVITLAKREIDVVVITD